MVLRAAGTVPDFAAARPGVDQHDERAAEAEQPGMMRVDGDFPDEKERGEKAGDVGADGEDAVAGKGAGDAEEKASRSAAGQRARDAGEDDDDAAGDEREALRGVGAHDVDRVDLGEAGEARGDEEDEAGVEQRPADGAGAVAGDVGGERQQPGQRAVVQAEKGEPLAAAESGRGGEDDRGGEDEPRDDEINGVRPESGACGWCRGRARRFRR